MSKRTPIGLQLDAISPFAPQEQISFDLRRLEVGLSTGLGADFKHYKATPSPIGKKDRGDYRRSDGVDTITSNGMIYTCGGVFTATMTDNTREQKRSAGGVLDPSESRLVLPRFYNAGDGGVSNGKRIYLMPGDRIYYSDPNADDRVVTAQEIDYQPDCDNQTLFPICCVDGPIVDSLGREFIQGQDFEITPAGDIRWIGNNPGIDVDTGKGRVFTIRYLYKAFYYIVALPKEVRITNVTSGGVRGPERMPYHAIVVREYIYHERNRGGKLNQNEAPKDGREAPPVEENINPNKYIIPVDMNTIAEGDE